MVMEFEKRSCDARNYYNYFVDVITFNKKKNPAALKAKFVSSIHKLQNSFRNHQSPSKTDW